MPSEKPTRLTYAQLVNILCILEGRIKTTEEMMDVLAEYLKELDATTEFQNYQIIKARMETLRENNKTPYGRLLDLEKQFSGLIQFVNNKIYEQRKPKRQSKYS